MRVHEVCVLIAREDPHIQRIRRAGQRGKSRHGAQPEELIPERPERSAERHPQPLHAGGVRAARMAALRGARVDLTARLLASTKEGAATLGISIVDIRIKRINLPEDGNILTSVFERMRAERTRVANQLRAEGSEGSDEIRSEAERERQVILAEAERDAQRLRGAGDAKAAELAAAAYGQDAEFYAFYRSLEAYRNSMADGQTVLVLDPDSEFLRHFGTDKR